MNELSFTSFFVHVSSNLGQENLFDNGERGESDESVPQKQDSKWDIWRSEAGHATSQSQRLPTILTFNTSERGRNILFLWSHYTTSMLQ